MVEVSLTVGKLDASLALLLTKDHHLIEFPTILLPAGVRAGLVVLLRCEQDRASEQREAQRFQQIQDEILNTFGRNMPAAPVLRVRNVTQTLCVLEWDALDLGTANLKNLVLYKDGQKLGAIPQPLTQRTTKLLGLPIDKTFEFQLRLDTTAGVFSLAAVEVTTHKMTDLSGITVCVGDIGANEPFAAADIEATLAAIGAHPPQDRVKVDTTHFLCTRENKQNPEYVRASEMNIPIVRPEWLKACERERRIVGVREFYVKDCVLPELIGRNYWKAPEARKVSEAEAPEAEASEAPEAEAPKAAEARKAAEAEAPEAAEARKAAEASEAPEVPVKSEAQVAEAEAKSEAAAPEAPGSAALEPSQAKSDSEVKGDAEVKAESGAVEASAAETRSVALGAPAQAGSKADALPESLENLANLSAVSPGQASTPSISILAPEPASEPASKAVTEQASEPVTEQASEPANEPASEPVTEPASDPASEPASEPANEPVTEPVTEPASEPVAEPVTEPASEPAAESGNPDAADTADAADPPASGGGVSGAGGAGGAKKKNKKKNKK